MPLAASISLTDGPAASVKNSDSLAGVYDSKGSFLSATGHIQTAVDHARSGATIFLWPKIYYDNVKVDKSITIKGFSPYLTIVDGSKATDPNFGSVFMIGMNEKGEYVPGVTATLSGLTIRKGTGTFIPELVHDELVGGGIYNDRSTLTVKNCIIKDNTAIRIEAYGCGGGIFNGGLSGTAILTVINSKIFGNTAGYDYLYEAGYGGGIYSDGTLGSATLTLTNSWIFGNTADYGYGGGIYNGGEGGTATLTLTNSWIFGNTADLSGGGVYNNGANSGTATLTLTKSRIFGNTAETGGGIVNDIGLDGTAIVDLQSGSIDHNTATRYGGGGIFNLGDITGNKKIVHDNTPNDIFPPLP